MKTKKTKEELNELAIKSKTSKDSLGDLFKEYSAAIKNVAGMLKRKNLSLDFDDIAQEVSYGLLRAVDKYEDNKGASFSTHANIYMVGFGKKYVKSQKGAGRSESRLSRKIYSCHAKNKEFLADKSIDFIAAFYKKELGLKKDIDKYDLIVSLNRLKAPEQLDQELGDEDGAFVTKKDMLAADISLTSDEKVDLFKIIEKSMKNLNEFEADVLKMRIVEQHSLREIAEKWNKSEQVVFNAENRVIRKIKESISK